MHVVFSIKPCGHAGWRVCRDTAVIYENVSLPAAVNLALERANELFDIGHASTVEWVGSSTTLTLARLPNGP